MKQILQNIKTGHTELVDVPVPVIQPGYVLIASRASLISVGTERMLVDFGKAGWIEKARQQPDKVRQVMDKVRTDGLLPTVETVFNKLDEPMPLGYCNAGVVLEVGAGITDLKPGDRVASNGPHAELVCVPRNLCAKVPDSVADEEAAFAVLGSIAIQGLRLASPGLGERFMVFGLGLVGLLTVQLMRANGCRVLAVDLNESRLRLAESFGAETVNPGAGADPVAAALAFSGGRGVDGVVIAASAKGDDIVHQAAQACRKRGRIVLVGVADLNLRRADFYEKELSFQVSCSYGPGRYDEKYEQAGHDYPFGFVRWTEQRNIEAVLEAMQAGQLRVNELITHRIPMNEAADAYDRVLHDHDALGIILEYPEHNDNVYTINIADSEFRPAGRCGIALIGAGNFSKMIMAPALSKTSARLKYISDNRNGAAAAHIARKYGFEHASSDMQAIMNDREVDAVFIATTHNSHAPLICMALANGKHVFVEKPLAIDVGGLGQVVEAVRKHPGQQVMVGFNRRFSPHVVKMKELLAARSEPLAMSMMVNAGTVLPNSWVHDPETGGGRIIGEACHFIDLMVHLAGCRVVTVAAVQMGGQMAVKEDKMSIVLSFEDGSVGTVNYFANGNKAYPKEALEVYSEGRILKMNNFRTLDGYGFKGFRKFRTWQMDKGHRAEAASFVALVESGGSPLISFSELVNVTLASFAAVASSRAGRVVMLEKEYGELCIK